MIKKIVSLLLAVFTLFHSGTTAPVFAGGNQPNGQMTALHLLKNGSCRTRRLTSTF